MKVKVGLLGEMEEDKVKGEGTRNCNSGEYYDQSTLFASMKMV
jgi:hypothetical protein